MRFLIIIAVMAAVTASPDNAYDEKKYESIDFDEVLSNIRMLKAYALCFLGKGQCTPEGKDIKKTIPDAVESDCNKCTENQKSVVAKFIKAIMESLPEIWEELLQMYNPKRDREQALKEFIEKYGTK